MTQQVIYTCKTKFLLSLILWNYFWFFFATNEQLYISFHMKVDTRRIIEQCIFLWRFCACFWSATQMPNSRIQVSSSVTIPGTKTSVIKWAGNQNVELRLQRVILVCCIFINWLTCIRTIASFLFHELETAILYMLSRGTNNFLSSKKSIFIIQKNDLFVGDVDFLDGNVIRVMGLWLNRNDSGYTNIFRV